MSNIHKQLEKHQIEENNWKYQEYIVDFHKWIKIFNFEFKLDLEDISLRVDYLSRRAYGTYREEHNGFGLRGEITMNSRYLDRDYWKTLGTLLHELLHGWQERHGKSGKWNYHNKQFQRKANELGLIVDKKGVTTYHKEDKSPFLQLLKKHGVDTKSVLDIDKPVTIERVKPKLRKWSCGCTNVRVGVRKFEAKCLVCYEKFELKD